MKAGIAAAPERVLWYGVKESARAGLSAALKELSIEERQVMPEELGQQVGYLAGFAGFQPRETEPAVPPEWGGMLCMCGLSGKRMDALLQALREQRADIPIKAAVAASNQRWTFAKLVEELCREHAALGANSPK